MKKLFLLTLLFLPWNAFGLVHVGVGDPITTSSVTISGTGIRFADGTVQVTSATSSAGTITGVTGSNGLTGGGSSGSLTVSVSSVSLSTQVIGNLPVTNLNSGSSASSSSFWRGDGTWVSSSTLDNSTLLPSTQTWTGLNTWTTVNQSSFSYGVAVGSLTLTGSGAGEVDFAEGTVPSGISSTDIMWGDTINHWLSFNPNNTSAYVVLGASTTLTNGHCIQVSGTGAMMDTGAACLSLTAARANGLINNASQFGIPYYSISGSSNVLSTASLLTWNGTRFQVDGAANFTSTFTVTNITSTTYTNISTFSVTSAYIDLSNSTMTAFSAKFSTASVSSVYSLFLTSSNHVSSGGVATSTATCGTGAGFTGTDFAGFITPGATASGCQVVFGSPYKNIPTCVVSERTMSLVNALSYTVDRSSLTISQTSLSSILDYICTGLKE